MKSMTGFGRAKIEVENRIYTVEIKSVNHRYSDITVKMPRSLSYLEDKIRKKMASNIARGKIDISITFENYSQQGRKIVVNHELANHYIEELKKCAKENEVEPTIMMTEVMKLPDIVTITTVEDEESIEQELLKCEEEAIKNFIQMRQKEAEQIKKDLYIRIENIKQKVEKIEKIALTLVEEYREKLQQRVQELMQTQIVDEARISMEAIIYADKCSVEEELTRLKSHLLQVEQLLKQEGAIGKKLDFIIQEMNRETNTIGSKSVKLEMTDLVVEIKTQLEDIREQIQNIE